MYSTLPLSLGIDIGSTTAKAVLMDGDDILFQVYERHLSQVREKTLDILRRMEPLLEGRCVTVSVSGSAGLGMAQQAELPFVQEVYATAETVRRLAPDTGTVIELGGEDAKVIFFKGGVDQRMNGTCAGGTGAFIDQMAILLDMTVEEMDRASLTHTRIYPIASRCGVFAKTDIQPLLNQGASKADVAASIYQAVVNQTIVGLAQGRKLAPNILFLGGPLYYCQGLRDRFRETLGLDEHTAVFPEYGRFAVAMGAALYSRSSQKTYTAQSLRQALEHSGGAALYDRSRLAPLFADEAELAAFRARHGRATVELEDLDHYTGEAWLGIDSGSTTTKLVLLSRDKKLLYSFYSSNKGDPVALIRQQLEIILERCGDRVKICGSACTGYGEELIGHAFGVDEGLVETIAHFTAARHFQPDVDFILDIGGQDIKCFKIKHGAIDSILLNEACSSGCGSFLETFARSMGYEISDFAQKGLSAAAPVNLGSRCTVFMNSSVKQAQKDGATVEDISAGLSISVVKNAIYKVIRASSPQELGSHLVVQGGTFLNDAVLRAFEQELGAPVIRPAIAGLMGAFGAALHAMRFSKSNLISRQALAAFTHTSRSAVCGGCTNHCHLTVNTFSGGKRFISGNQCQKGTGGDQAEEGLPNLYSFKRDLLMSLTPVAGHRGKLGLPLALGMYELAPLWHGLFTALGFEVVLSGLSSRRTYEKGQYSIPSDTACYPAKIMHGHMEQLLELGIDTIFYPCLSYNTDEGRGDNHYNCPVVAYYAELLHGNMDHLKNARFLYPYLNINSKKQLIRTLLPCLQQLDGTITRSELSKAVDAGFHAQQQYHEAVRRQGQLALEFARANGRRIMILAGRPYHIDPEICHGIDKLANSLGFVVVSEDSVCELASQTPQVRVLNQWTYHARLYRAAQFAAENADVQLVQLVSFGCGVDAITTDEVRTILEQNGKLYTQLKIDEITNQGAVKIRLRSLLGALDAQ